MLMVLAGQLFFMLHASSVSLDSLDSQDWLRHTTCLLNNNEDPKNQE